MLRDIEMRVEPGEIVALVGSNGAGKTTLLRALSRLLRSTGRIEFDGREIGALTPEEVFRRGLVQVPEGRQLFDNMTVHENLLMGAYRRTDRLGIAESLERVYVLFPHLAKRRGIRAGNMSGGEQQMCALARGLMAAPKLLMIDEMSLGLAPVVVDQLREVLLEIRNQGVTVLLVEQDVFFAFEVADRGYVLEGGSVVREGTAKALANDPQVQRAYFGL
ncbi:High-affinity branched-chain amino acid transport ATP-binding protein LivF [Burkholderiales bacterium]|nr:High-affinity branched-chain amino acid transport ATP-binding protein LivF [Burkholderiales bacterium]